MFGHTMVVKKVLEEAGYSFVKRESDDYWLLISDGEMVDECRSQGDLIRKTATDLGVW